MCERCHCEESQTLHGVTAGNQLFKVCSDCYQEYSDMIGRWMNAVRQPKKLSGFADGRSAAGM